MQCKYVVTVFPDTSIMDTTTEEIDEPETPRKISPAARVTRRSSTSRLATPAKVCLHTLYYLKLTY